MPFHRTQGKRSGALNRVKRLRRSAGRRERGNPRREDSEVEKQSGRPAEGGEEGGRTERDADRRDGGGCAGVEGGKD